MDTKKKRAIIAASVAGLMAATSLFGVSKMAQAGTEGMESCYGINACKGMGACGGKGNSCAGKNGCKGQGSIEVPKGSCMKIQGGSLTPAA